MSHNSNNEQFYVTLSTVSLDKLQKRKFFLRHTLLSAKALAASRENLGWNKDIKIFSMIEIILHRLYISLYS